MMKPSTIATRARKADSELKQLTKWLRDSKRNFPQLLQQAIESGQGEGKFHEHYRAVKARLDRLSEIEKELKTLDREQEKNEFAATRARGWLRRRVSC